MFLPMPALTFLCTARVSHYGNLTFCDSFPQHCQLAVAYKNGGQEFAMRVCLQFDHVTAAALQTMQGGHSYVRDFA